MKITSEKQAVIYRFGRFQMNAREGLLLREGEIVPLTPKIFEMLLLLVQNNGRMLSKDEIMETIWADSFVEETNLTSNISRLRKILHAGGEQYIETFPKRGYRFRAEVEEVSPETEIILTRRVRTQVRQIVEETGEPEFAPEYAAYLTEVPNNLTPSTTRIIGREKEIGEIENLLRQNRLVTLTGIGGTGKTRIAQETALRMLAEFPDGVFFIPLSAIRNPDFVVSEITQSFGLKQTPEKSLTDALKDFLRAKKILLVIDNFEQVVSAAPLLSELLAAAPNLKILTTSRAVLHLEAEHEYVVPPLDLPEDMPDKPVKDLFEYESVKLFIERARAAKSQFAADDKNALTVAEICERLEGLPLAIELAAARIKILSPSQILERLDNRLKLLTGGARSLPTRQQTMRDAIAWSFDLLDENEKSLFCSLAVFAGGFTIETVEEICGGHATDENPAPEIDVLNGITSLVENSLLVQAEAADGKSRFRLLEIVREYALEMLERRGEIKRTADKHARYFLALTEKADPEILGKQGSKWLDLLQEEHENIRAAMDWADKNNPEVFVRIVAATRDFWVVRNHLGEGRQSFEKAVEKSGGASGEAICKIFIGLGQTAKYQGDFAAAHKAFEKALEVSRKINDKQRISISTRGLAMTAKGRGDFAAARKYAEESLRISRETGDKFGIAVSVNTLGDIACIEKDYKTARPFYEEALEICTELNSRQGVNATLNNLGAVAFGEKDYKTARDYYARALNLWRDSGEKVTFSYTFDGFAALAVERGDFKYAAQLSGAAEQMRKSLGFITEPAERNFRDQYLNRLRSLIDEQTFSKYYEQGRNLKTKEAVALALK